MCAFEPWEKERVTDSHRNFLLVFVFFFPVKKRPQQGEPVEPGKDGATQQTTEHKQTNKQKKKCLHVTHSQCWASLEKNYINANSLELESSHKAKCGSIFKIKGRCINSGGGSSFGHASWLHPLWSTVLRQWVVPWRLFYNSYCNMGGSKTDPQDKRKAGKQMTK